MMSDAFIINIQSSPECLSVPVVVHTAFPLMMEDFQKCGGQRCWENEREAPFYK